MSNTDSPEDLISVFKDAALSVTKLYKTSASAQAKARADGYQDCLDDLLSFLDKEGVGQGQTEGDGCKIRRWVLERVEGSRDPVAPAAESEDEADKVETASSPELHRRSSIASLPAAQHDTAMRTDSAPPSIKPTIVEEPEIVVPTQDTFNFQSSIQYPQESYMELANLDLSDNRPAENNNTHATAPAPSITISRPSRGRHGGIARAGSKGPGNLGRGAGAKRKINLGEIFDLSSLGIGKDAFGNRGGKRSRHM